VRVVEIAPPAVKSNLGGSHAFGEDLDVFCEAVMAKLAAGALEVAHGFSETGRFADRVEVQSSMVGLAKSMHCSQFKPPE